MVDKKRQVRNDFYSKAEPDEPVFVLLARDPDFSSLVRHWIWRRRQRIARGQKPASDEQMCNEAEKIAEAGDAWLANRRRS